LKELLARDPTHEDVHRDVMELYVLSGNKHQALRQYELCREALREGLGAEPEPATRELRQQIVSGQLVPMSVSSADQVQTINSLAVLPLVNATSDPNAEYLSDGITESIINSLSQLPQLKVMSRNTVFRYKGREIDSSQVGRELNVRTLLLGRVLQFGDRLVVRVELIDAREGTQLWGEQFNRCYDDIFELQEEIAREIAGKLRLRLSGAEKGRLTKRYTENAEAYGLYLKGRYFWNKRTLETLEKSIEYFKKAIELDPDYALAYVGVADSYTKLGDVGIAALPPSKAFSIAKVAAIRALENDSALAEAHTSLGHLNLHDYEWLEAEREFKHAIELNPNYATAHHWYAYQLLMNGRQSEAINEIEQALFLDPLSLPINADYGEVLYFARRPDQAIEQLRKTLEMDPHFYPTHSDLARVYEQVGRYEEAIREIQTALALAPKSTDALATLAHIYAASGKKEQALHLLEQLNEVAKSKYVSPYGVAVVYTALGDADHAFKWLQTATEEHAAWVIYLNVDPRLDSLRREPRFKSLLDSVGLSGSSHE
jgi:TolB-like protein/Tfp pilus assembly protein PilF